MNRLATPQRPHPEAPAQHEPGRAGLAPCACGRLRRATRALTQLYDDALAPAGLRLTQFALLRTLQRIGSIGITELAAHELLDRTALSRNLDPLIARGLVETVRGQDARTRAVVLTATGRRELAAAEPHWRRVQDDVTRRVGAEKLELLVEALGDLEQLHPHVSSSVQERP